MANDNEEKKGRIQQFAEYSSRLAETQVAGIFGQLTAPVIGKIQGFVAKNLPLLAPPPGAILGAYLKGRISDADFFRAMGKYGMNVGQVRAAEEAKLVGLDVEKNIALWAAVMEDMKTFPGVGSLLRAYWTGLLGEEGSKDAKAKLDSMGKVYATDRIHWETCEPTMRPWPGLGELNAGRNRGILTPKEYEELVRLSSGQRKDCRELHDQLRQTPPGIGEILSICSKTLSKRDDSPLRFLWRDFPEEFRKWCGWYGLDFDTNIEAPKGAVEGTVRWPAALWAAHWRSPGWGAIQQILWRIRDDNRDEWQSLGANAVSLSLDDVREWLKHDGTPEPIREQLLAMRFVPVSVRYLKTMWQQNIVNTPFAENELKNAGNDPRVVDYIIKSWIKEKEEKEQKPHDAKKQKENDRCEQQRRAAIESDVELGLIDPDKATELLATYGIGNDCVLAAMQRRMNRLKAAILAKIKSLYLTGGLDLSAACKALCAEGFTDSASREYLAAWTDELSLELREAAGASVARWLRLGMITLPDARLRLTQLGFSAVDQALMLLASDVSADKLALDAMSTLAPQGRVAASSVVRLLKSAERIRKQAEMSLRKLFPVGRIKRDYVTSLRSEDWAREKLELIGESLESRDNYLAEWNAQIESKASKAAKTPASPSPDNPPVPPAGATADSQSASPDQSSLSQGDGTSGT